MDDTIELRQLLKIIRQKILFILTVTVVLTLVAGLGSEFLLKPQYEATSDLLLNIGAPEQGATQQATINQQDITSNLLLIQTYMNVIVSPRIMEPAAKQLGIPIDTLTKQIRINNVTNSQVISVVAKDMDPNKAIQIANTVSTIFKSQIPVLMKVDNVSVLTPAQVAKQVWPLPVVSGAVAFVVGLIFTIGYLLGKEYLDTRLRKEEDIEKYLGLPVLGKVNVIKKMKKNQLPKSSLQMSLEPGGTEI